MRPSRASWSRPADRGRYALASLVAVVCFLAAWGLLHVGFYEHDQIADTPIYQRYGERIARGDVPYRDFRVEYPPGALPAFAVPTLGDRSEFREIFEWLMAACGAAMVLLVGATLAVLRASLGHVVAALAFVAFAPLALGSVVLTRFDLWPAAVTAAALAAFVGDRHRLGAAALGLGVAVKLYPIVVAPIAFAWTWRRRGRGEAVVAAAIAAGVVLAAYLPFLILGPSGVAAALGRQLSRPLQIESLGAAFVLASHHVVGTGIEMKSSHGSQNVAGAPGLWVGVAQTVVQLGALAAIWAAFARDRSPTRERLVVAAATALVAFVALGKVLSPQFLIWLLPVIPLVRGRRGLAASGVLAVALVLTQLWFPFRYWDLARRFDEVASWLVLGRDLVLVGLLALLAWPWLFRTHDTAVRVPR